MPSLVTTRTVGKMLDFGLYPLVAVSLSAAVSRSRSAATTISDSLYLARGLPPHVFR